MRTGDVSTACQVHTTNQLQLLRLTWCDAGFGQPDVLQVSASRSRCRCDLKLARALRVMANGRKQQYKRFNISCAFEVMFASCERLSTWLLSTLAYLLVSIWVVMVCLINKTCLSGWPTRYRTPTSSSRDPQNQFFRALSQHRHKWVDFAQA